MKPGWHVVRRPPFGLMRTVAIYRPEHRAKADARVLELQDETDDPIHLVEVGSDGQCVDPAMARLLGGLIRRVPPPLNGSHGPIGQRGQGRPASSSHGHNKRPRSGSGVPGHCVPSVPGPGDQIQCGECPGTHTLIPCDGDPTLLFYVCGRLRLGVMGGVDMAALARAKRAETRWWTE